MSTEKPATRSASYLSPHDIHALDHACIPIRRAFGSPPYLVGSVLQRSDYRDIDLRLILFDDDYDALFGCRPPLFQNLIGYAISRWLETTSGLRPVDFQIQRMTEANAEFGGQPRNPMGMDRMARALGSVSGEPE